MEPSIDAAVTAFVQAARARYGRRLERVTLYGSHARGEAGPESDVDLLVVWDGSRRDARAALAPLATDTLLRLQVDLSIHPIASDEAPMLDAGATSFFRHVLEDGIPVA